MIKVLFVCMGNVCRSPMAEAVFSHLVEQAGLADRFEIDSVGTDSYHVGDPAHPGTRRVLAAAGIASRSISRQVTRRDLDKADYVIAMDRHNVSDLGYWAPRGALDGRLHLLLDFVDERERRANSLPATKDVPDPYYSGDFEGVYRLPGAAGPHPPGAWPVSLPPSLAAAVAGATGAAVVESRAVGGGDISQAARLRLADGRELLLKWRSGPPTGIFTAEQRGLDLLGRANALRVPLVFACADQSGAEPGFIAMEWLGRGSSTPAAAAALGAGLAALHRVTASSYGLDHDNFIGANPQPNRAVADWVSFFREQRLGYQMELAGRNGYLPRNRAGRLETLLARLGDWLPANPPASLLHGDLWGGNWLVSAAGEPALIDPVVYYGHREADLAFTELFGGFPASFYAAYRQAWPLDQGYEERKELYNLYHLLNHLNLFGEGYGGSVDAILRRYTA